MKEECILVLDTCGERSSLALARGELVLSESLLEERAASTVLLQAIRELLDKAGVGLQRLTAVGVVNGPGSFTGLRVGLATAKGLCEAMDLPLAAVSRLAVLVAAGQAPEAWAVLRAGRDEVYVRHAGPDAAERMVSNEELLRLTSDKPVVYAEASLAPLFTAVPHAHLIPLAVRHALPLVRLQLANEGKTDLALLDANYVRNEQAIYKQKQSSL